MIRGFPLSLALLSLCILSMTACGGFSQNAAAQGTPGCSTGLSYCIVNPSSCSVTIRPATGQSGLYNYTGSCSLSFSPVIATSVGPVHMNWASSNVGGDGTANGSNPVTFVITGRDVCISGNNSILDVYSSDRTTHLATAGWDWHNQQC